MKVRGSSIALLLIAVVGTACPSGEDYTPIYFRSGDADALQPAISTPMTEDLACTIQFTATLCVALQSDAFSAGNIAEGETPLCTASLPPIPIDIKGSEVTLRGELFPDIVIEGHGLPVAITINGRGDGDGRSNVGVGTLSAAGELTIEDFDLYIRAFDTVGIIPRLTLTTGTAPGHHGMAPISGTPIGPEGQLRLVTSTTLGSLFASADETLKGAGLSAVFEGTIQPALKDCHGGAGHPTHFEITKLIIDAQGNEVAIPIPEGNQLEISTGTFLAVSATDVGPRFEGQAKFRITNITDTPLTVHIPPRLGPFLLSSTGALNRKLPPQATMTLLIRFQPQANTVEGAGVITQELSLGEDVFVLRGQVLPAQGQMAIDLLANNGQVRRERIESLHLGTIYVPASARRAYFQCEVLLCGGAPLPTACRPCGDLASGQCQLLAIDGQGLPRDEVDARCTVLRPQSTDVSVINFGSDGEQGFLPLSQVVAIRNTGPAPLTITGIELVEDPTSQSTAQFLFTPSTVVVAASYPQIAAALRDPASSSTTFPFVLPPHEPPLTTTQAFLVVGYHPTDLMGADGRVAGVGTTVTDQASLRIASDTTEILLPLRGSTTIKDIPPLQVYFGTSTGLKERRESESFAFQGITMDTRDLAVPLLVRVPESAAHPVRITGVQITGPDTTAFEWLDAAEEIAAKPDAARCALPRLDAEGHVTTYETELRPVSLAPSGYDLAPGAHTVATMPLLGCVNFHPDLNQVQQRHFTAILTVVAQQLGPDKKPIRNPDGSLKQSEFQIPLLAVIDPLQGPMVFRVNQTMSVILNRDFPTVAAVASGAELDAQIAAGLGQADDRFMFLFPLILDPFDQATIRNEQGEIISAPDDGFTGVFRAVDTHPTKDLYAHPLLKDYANLSFDTSAPAGAQGLFFDYEQVPEGLQAPSLRIFTASLSYPGPLVPADEVPEQPSMCEVVDPCSPEGQRKFADGPTEPGKRGVCAYFYTSAGDYDSSAFSYADEREGGTRTDLCTIGDGHQELRDLKGYYYLDGHMDFDVGLSFWGPTYYHNPHGDLGNKPPLDQVWHMNLTTHVIRPPRSEREPNLIPSERINRAKQEYKINLNSTDLETPPICARNTKNQPFGNTLYSTWKYLAPLLSRDEDGLIPARCEDGGSAFVHGRPLDHATGILTVVGIDKFSSDDDVTFAFKDVVLFVVLNGWLCDPLGAPEDFEGLHCYDLEQNERDRRSHISIMEATP